jgi:XTP/dITP diphosphohydrolase
LQGVALEERTARFKCVLCFKQKGGEARYFSGTCEGRILPAPAGEMGFGYDPLFQPNGYTGSFAELGSAVKNQLSHRGKALKEWVKFLKEATR